MGRKYPRNKLRHSRVQDIPVGLDSAASKGKDENKNKNKDDDSEEEKKGQEKDDDVQYSDDGDLKN